jgi:hypothetical protein
MSSELRWSNRRTVPSSLPLMIQFPCIVVVTIRRTLQRIGCWKDRVWCRFEPVADIKYESTLLTRLDMRRSLVTGKCGIPTRQIRLHASWDNSWPSLAERLNVVRYALRHASCSLYYCAFLLCFPLADIVLPLRHSSLAKVTYVLSTWLDCILFVLDLEKDNKCRIYNEFQIGIEYHLAASWSPNWMTARAYWRFR